MFTLPSRSTRTLCSQNSQVMLSVFTWPPKWFTVFTELSSDTVRYCSLGPQVVHCVFTELSSDAVCVRLALKWSTVCSQNSEVILFDTVRLALKWSTVCSQSSQVMLSVFTWPLSGSLCVHRTQVLAVCDLSPQEVFTAPK